jgi:hypothetical protein
LKIELTQDNRQQSVYKEIIALKLGEIKIKKKATAPEDKCNLTQACNLARRY